METDRDRQKGTQLETERDRETGTQQETVGEKREIITKVRGRTKFYIFFLFRQGFFNCVLERQKKAVVLRHKIGNVKINYCNVQKKTITPFSLFTPHTYTQVISTGIF